MTIETGKIYNEDCMETMGRMDDNEVDIVVTSPPYNVGDAGMVENKYKNIDDNRDDYCEWLLPKVGEMIRVSKNVFFNIQILTNNKMAVLELLAEYKDNFKDVLVWGKHNTAPATEPGVMNSQFEFIFCFSDRKPDKRKFYDQDWRGEVSNLLLTSNNSNNEYSDNHKAVFKSEVPRYIIKNFSNKDEVVYDPFMGVGTTAHESEKLNRKWIGSEISEEYCEIARERIKRERDQRKLL